LAETGDPWEPYQLTDPSRSGQPRRRPGGGRPG